MIVSHNEILGTCRRVLESKGFSQGIWEDVADSIAWLAQIGISAVQPFCASLDQLRPVNSGWEIVSDRPNRFAFNTNGGSCLQFGSLAADYALVKASEHAYAIGTIDGAERGLWIGYLRTIAAQGIHCSVSWQSAARWHQYRFAANEAFPDYLCEQVETQDDGKLYLSMSQTPLSLAWENAWTFSREHPTPPVIVARMTSAEFAAKRQHHLYHGIEVNESCWLRLKAEARGILVEDSAESRSRGAGGA